MVRGAPQNDTSLLYSEAKQAAGTYQTVKLQWLKGLQEAGLGTWVRKPPEQENFTMTVWVWKPDMGITTPSPPKPSSPSNRPPRKPFFTTSHCQKIIKRRWYSVVNECLDIIHVFFVVVWKYNKQVRWSGGLKRENVNHVLFLLRYLLRYIPFWYHCTYPTKVERLIKLDGK